MSWAKIPVVRIDRGNRQISRGQNELTTKLAGTWPKKNLHFRNVGAATRQGKSHIDCDKLYGTGDILLKSRVH